MHSSKSVSILAVLVMLLVVAGLADESKGHGSGPAKPQERLALHRENVAGAGHSVANTKKPDDHKGTLNYQRLLVLVAHYKCFAIIFLKNSIVVFSDFPYF